LPTPIPLLLLLPRLGLIYTAIALAIASYISTGHSFNGKQKYWYTSRQQPSTISFGEAGSVIGKIVLQLSLGKMWGEWNSRKRKQSPPARTKKIYK